MKSVRCWLEETAEYWANDDDNSDNSDNDSDDDEEYKEYEEER